ncbi:hypothetical protein F5Y00DRAFT_262093 [Daldinia vernicosa]|uniref:uncharacterized protein n=1 Tax=Daldinia vernicosa TaxID=114800 RepID=UPI0020088CDD|nr:uncharacterized protein F5Y00DRAFT_262093 [Daldinia vernicosa]KAI0848936.1 hypothetical protein F5Y00DRAFT_262093 [Daldinia vernicosa]
MTTPEVSHGRGGAGNINPDDTKYVDGEIVRQGAANIADADKPPSATRADRDIVPEEATRPSTDGESFHVGRGGAANVHLSEQDKLKKQEKHHGSGANKVVDTPSTPGTAPHVSLADKLKHKIFGVFKK